MCRNNYVVHWDGDGYNNTKRLHCPYLVPDNAAHKDKHGDSVSVVVQYKPKTNFSHHKSLAHLWNDYYQGYNEAISSYPRLIIRYEDLIFHTSEVVKSICHCTGGRLKSDDGSIEYSVESTKNGQHGHRAQITGLIQSLVKYGHKKSRLNMLKETDEAFAREAFDRKLMEEFGYVQPPKN